MIPIRRPHVKWDYEGNLIKLKIYRNHWYDKILHRVFKTPLEITIDLDEIGSTVWQLIDGETTIRQIGEKLQEQMEKWLSQPTLVFPCSCATLQRGSNLLPEGQAVNVNG